MPSSTLLDALVGDAEIAAYFTDRADIEAMLAFERALARSEAEFGLVSQDAAAAIEAVALRFEPDLASLATGMARDGVIVPDLVRQLRLALGEPHADAVHVGATSQDVVDTSLVLRLARVLPVLDGRLSALQAALAELECRDGEVVVMAHTRMQQALPVRARDKLAAWSAPLARHRARLAEIGPRLLVLQFGGPVGDRRGLDGKGGAVAAALASRLGLAPASPWHSQRDGIGEFAGLLAGIAGSLGKFGADITLLAQNEVGAVALSGAGGSSAMAHKSNPVAAEVLVALARHAAGLSGIVQQAMVHENERSGAAWTLEWMSLPPLVVATGASLNLATRLAAQIGFRPQPGPSA